MATPVGDSYGVASGGVIAAGRTRHPNAVLDLIAAAPANSWIKLNTNTFQSAWSPSDLRATYPYSGTVDSPSLILGAWGSMGWDSRHSRAIVFGGGHANIGINEVYHWSAYTRQWENSFLATRLYQVDSYPSYRSVDGNASPVSSHTYSNNNYLPVLDRFYTGGGAAYGNGGPLSVWSGDTFLRHAGGFTLDMSLAGQGYVGGVTGSNIKYGSYASIDIPGANAWKLRDWGLNNPATLTTGWNGNALDRIEGGTVVVKENNHDVMYWLGNSRLWRTEFVDDNSDNDIVTQISGYENGFASNGAMAIDPVKRVILKPNGRYPQLRLFHMLDLDAASTASGFQSITSMTGDSQTGFIGDFGLTTSSGIAYDENKGCFVLWMKGRQPWLIYSPSGSPTPTTGWEVIQPTMDTGTTCPPEDIGTNNSGVIGKFRYAPDLKCCVCIENTTEGNVWALKLSGWQDPRN